MNLFLTRLRGAGPTPVVVAHRGDCSKAPENTLLAAELGWDAGADAWEFDVHLSRDGVPLLIHDESLRRTTDVARAFRDDPRVSGGAHVSDFDFEEIQSLDAGSWFLQHSGAERTADRFGGDARINKHVRTRCLDGSVRMPSLAEALRFTAERGWLANVEVKSYPNRSPQLLNAVIKVVGEAGIGSSVLISSFDHRDVARASRESAGIATGVLIDHPLASVETYVADVVRADCVHSSTWVLGSECDGYRRTPRPESLDRETIAALRLRDVLTLAYTVNDVRPDGLAVHLAAAGAAGLFTDDVRGMRALFPV